MSRKSAFRSEAGSPQIRIPPRSSSDALSVCIEVTRGSHVRYEASAFSDGYRVYPALRRTIHSTVPFPCHYGIVPDSLTNTGKPLGVFVFSDAFLAPLEIFKARPLGGVRIRYADRMEDLLIAVHSEHADALSFADSIQELPADCLTQLGRLLDVLRMIGFEEPLGIEEFIDRDRISELLDDATSAFHHHFQAC